MCKQLQDERRHVAISLWQTSKGGSACVRACVACVRARGDEGQEAGLSQI